MIGYSTISFDLTDGIGNLALNQPPSNHMNGLFFAELEKLVEGLKGLTEIKALVISGKGRHFSSGASLDELMEILAEEKSADENRFFNRNIKVFKYFQEARIPVISSIRGVCIGSAMELALFSHFRFCGEDAVFGLPETTFNLMPGIGGISHLIKVSGKAKAIELVLRGMMFPAINAMEYGLVDRIVPKRDVVRFSNDFARAIWQGYQKDKKLLYLKRIDERSSLNE